MTLKHKIKIMPQYFEAVQSKIKTAEVRYCDRAYKKDDWLVMEEWTGEEYTGRFVVRRITAVYKLDAMGLDGYVLICMK